MELVLLCVMMVYILLCVPELHVVQCAEDYAYDTYIVDSRLCARDKDSNSIYIKPWKAVILTYGNPPGSDIRPSHLNTQKCKIPLRTQKNFSLGAVIEEMNIAATLDRATHAWECDGDYLKMSAIGTSIFSRLLNPLTGDLFKDKTDRLCGVRRRKPRFSGVGSNADVFFTNTHEMDVTFYQRKSPSSPVNNSFRIVVTTLKNMKEPDACRDKYQCLGSENYCISQEYVCDAHYNCAVPFGGGDESKCKDPEPYSPSIFSTTTTIITSLASIVGAAFVIGCIIMMTKKIQSQSSTQSRSVARRRELLSEVPAPSIPQHHTLPSYEAVVMADADSSWKSSTPETPGADKLPPNYESIFPDGPPKSLNNSSSSPSNVSHFTPTTTAANDQEQNSNAASVSVATS